eukprot:gene1905-biopygen20735
MITPTCQTCGKQFEPVDGDPARLPLVFDCMCVFCRGCAVQHEAEHISSMDSCGGGEGVEGIPCLRCKKLRTTRLADLLPSLPHIAAAAASATRLAPLAPIPAPACDNCEDAAATQFCKDCHSVQQILCDGCHSFAHKSAKKRDHRPIPIQDHLRRRITNSQAGGSSPSTAAKPPTCQKHPDTPVDVSCDTCGTLICAMCAVLEHNGHDLMPIAQISSEHKDMVAANIALAVVARDEVVAANTALEGVCDQVRQNGKAAKEKVNLGFRRLMAEGKQRREALIAQVDDAVRFKCGLLEAQVTGTDKSSDNATNGIELAEATLKMASPTKMLQYTEVLVGGLQKFQIHGLVGKQACGPLVDVMLGDALDDIMTQIGTLGVLRTNDADPAASTATGEGLSVAKAGVAADFIVTAVEFVSSNVKTTGGDVLVVDLTTDIHGSSDGTDGGGSDDGGDGVGVAGASWEMNGHTIAGTVVDNGDGTYICSYTPPKGADERSGGWRLNVLLNGKHLLGSPFAIEVCPSNLTNWTFATTRNYVLGEGGAEATKVVSETHTGIVAGGTGCTPMTFGVHYWELEIVRNGTASAYLGLWYFGVCRPGIDLENGASFASREDTWMMSQNNAPGWGLCCKSSKGAGMLLDPKPMMPDGSRIGLLLDLDNGGTLTMYLDGTPCGTIAEGLAGPLLPCLSSYVGGKVVKIYGGLAPPQ